MPALLLRMSGFLGIPKTLLLRRVCLVIAVAMLQSATAGAAPIYVATTGADANPGTLLLPLRNIQTAIALAQPGDEIVVADGTYHERIGSVRGGTSDSERITVRAANPRNAVVTNPGRVLDVVHPYLNFDGLIFDGQSGSDDIVRISVGGDHMVFDNVEVRNGRRDGIDMGSNATTVGSGFNFLQGVRIQNSSVHDVLWADSNGVRQDAHGIVAGGVQDFVIRDTEVHYVSGDAFQLQDGGWDNVLLESVRFWNGPLPEARGGFAAGINPGEDGIDTKQDDNIPIRGRLTVRDSEFFGWRGSAPGIWSAMNLKEQIEAIIDGNTFYGNDVGIRLRGPTPLDAGAEVTVVNNVFYDHLHPGAFQNGSGAALSFDYLVENLKVWNNTFGADNARFFAERSGGPGSGLEILNNLFLGASTPTRASDSSNLAVAADSFVSALGGDYHLAPGSPAIDAGLPLVVHDRDGIIRPQGGGLDIGAFEAAAVGVPEPSTFALSLLALAVLGCMGRCKWIRTV